MTAETAPSDYDVVVVGAGPTGLTHTRLLATSGVRVAVVDPKRVVTHHPRATHIDDETMRTLQTLGAADLEPRHLRMNGWVLHDSEGHPFLSFAMPDVESDQGWYPDYQFHQPDFESRLRGLLASSHDAELWLGWTVAAVHQTAEQATVQVTQPKTGATRTLSAAYVVAADGANSSLRRQVSTHVEDLHGTQRSLIADIYPFEHPADLPRTGGFVYCDRNKPVTYLPIGPPRLRFEFMLQPGGDVNEYERPTTVYRLLSKWLDPGSYRIERADVYEWHAHLACGWRNGRLLIAGDAAHEMPPMLGQGMCSGLRDATNLAWKLAWVVSGRAAADLLDTYESERSAHVRPYIEESARQANMIEAFGYAENRPPTTEHQVLDRFRPPLGPGLADLLEDPVGQLAPQPRTVDGRRFDDVVGYNFAVLADAGVVAAVPDDVRAAWDQLGAVVMTGPSELQSAWLREHDADAVIVRPDRYVYATTHGSDELASATLALRDRLTREQMLAEQLATSS